MLQVNAPTALLAAMAHLWQPPPALHVQLAPFLCHLVLHSAMQCAQQALMLQQEHLRAPPVQWAQSATPLALSHQCCVLRAHTAPPPSWDPLYAQWASTAPTLGSQPPCSVASVLPH